METKETKQLTVVKKDISSQVLSKIKLFEKTGEIILPKDYSPENALKSAYLVLSETKNKQGQFALQHCSQESIANALLRMIVMGVSVLKRQCSLVMYANKLECMIEYTGNIVLAKRYGNLKRIKAVTIFEGDKFEFEIDTELGTKKVTKHEQTLESLGSKKVSGAYAVYELNDGFLDTEIMNIEQIKSAWNQGSMRGASPAHKNFPDQMANKTVINRACKMLIRGSDDNILYSTTPESLDVNKADMQHAIATDANKQEISLEETQTIEVDAETIVDNATKIKETPIVESKEENSKEKVEIKSTRTKVDKDGQANLDGPGF